jgi:hypothetical protein
MIDDRGTAVARYARSNLQGLLEYSYVRLECPATAHRMKTTSSASTEEQRKESLLAFACGQSCSAND